MAVHATRDTVVTDDDGNQYILPTHDGFWYSTTGNIIKWVIFLSLLFSFLGFFVFGRLLAQRRLKQGRAPAKWNRWLLSRRQRAIHEPRFRPFWPENQNQTFVPFSSGQPMPMGGGAFVPAPAYTANGGPPGYAMAALAPEGASKVDPVQGGVTVRAEETGEYGGYGGEGAPQLRPLAPAHGGDGDGYGNGSPAYPGAGNRM